jgi:hypothetical protein
LKTLNQTNKLNGDINADRFGWIKLRDLLEGMRIGQIMTSLCVLEFHVLKDWFPLLNFVIEVEEVKGDVEWIHARVIEEVINDGVEGFELEEEERVFGVTDIIKNDEIESLKEDISILTSQLLLL